MENVSLDLRPEHSNQWNNFVTEASALRPNVPFALNFLSVPISDIKVTDTN
jgi:hypothetical protein